MHKYFFKEHYIFVICTRCTSIESTSYPRFFILIKIVVVGESRTFSTLHVSQLKGWLHPWQYSLFRAPAIVYNFKMLKIELHKLIARRPHETTNLFWTLVNNSMAYVYIILSTSGFERAYVHCYTLAKRRDMMIVLILIKLLWLLYHRSRTSLL